VPLPSSFLKNALIYYITGSKSMYAQICQALQVSKIFLYSTEIIFFPAGVSKNESYWYAQHTMHTIIGGLFLK